MELLTSNAIIDIFFLESDDMVVGYITSIKIAILVNGSNAIFLKSTYGFQQGCLLYPYLFLLFAEGISICL